MALTSEQQFIIRTDRRARIEVVMDVLDKLHHNMIVGPYRLSNQTNVKYSILVRILTRLVALNWITVDTKGKRAFYQLTGKGLDRLKKWKAINRELSGNPDE